MLFYFIKMSGAAHFHRILNAQQNYSKFLLVAMRIRTKYETHLSITERLNQNNPSLPPNFAPKTYKRFISVTYVRLRLIVSLVFMQLLENFVKTRKP